MNEYLNYKGHKVYLEKIEGRVATLSQTVGSKFQDVRALYENLLNEGIGPGQISVKRFNEFYIVEILIPLSETLQLEAW